MRVTIDLRPSNSLSLFLIAIHLGAFIAICCIAVPVWLAIAVFVVLTISVLQQLRRYTLLSHPKAVIGIDFKQDDIVLKAGNGVEQHARLLKQSVQTRLINLLSFKTTEGKRIDVPVCQDMLSEKQHRLLQVYLRIS